MCACMCAHVCVYVYMYVCMYIRMYVYVTVPRKRDHFRKKMKNELFIPLRRALLMEYFDIKFIGRRSLVH